MKNLRSEDQAQYTANQVIIDKTINDQKVVDEALKIVESRIKRKSALTSPNATRDYLKLHFYNLKHEVFTVLYLDQRHRPIEIVDEFRGTIDGASVYPREIVIEALKHNAAAVIFAHNHPSGVAEPSQSDERITARLKDALALVDVRVLDHFVIGDEVVSFAERGLI